jgi:hypothetical protein
LTVATPSSSGWAAAAPAIAINISDATSVAQPTFVIVRSDTFADGDLFLTEEQPLPVFAGVFEPAATQISLGAALLVYCHHSQTCRQPLEEVARVVRRF